MSERVTVVVRTKNRSEFLSRALDDVAAQQFADWRVVVVNDGGDRQEVDRVVANSIIAERVSVVDSAIPQGRCSAANTGIGVARGEYVVLHDDDDRWDPSFLARTTEWLDTHPDDMGVMVSTAIVYEQKVESAWQEVRRVPFWQGMNRVSLSELLEINRAVPISFLYRRKLHDQVGWYDESLDAVEDWHFYLRIVPRFTIGFIAGRPLAFWAQRPSATGADANSMFDLHDQHLRDDLIVRDRELSAWTAQNGVGLPLYMAYLHRETRENIRRIVGEELDARRPETFLGRLRRRLRGHST